MSEFIILVDQSSSMDVMGNEPTDAINSFVEEQIKESKKLQTEDHKVKVYTFATAVKCVKKTTLKEWKPIDKLVPKGMTSLFDALGDVISIITEKNGILLVISDGEDNSSENYSLGKVKEMMKTLRQKQGWNIITMGANIESMKEAKSLGLKNVVNFDQHTPGNLTTLSRNISRNISSHMTQGRNVSEFCTQQPLSCGSTLASINDLEGIDNNPMTPLKRS